MALTAEALGEQYGITRAEVDAFALSSHHKAASHAQSHLAGEIAPYPLKKGKGGHLALDEHVRTGATLADLSKLKATFKKDGLVTAATASGVVDGGAALLLVSSAFALRHSLSALAALGPSAVVGVDPKLMGFGPVPAIRRLLAHTGQRVNEIALFEINEAFAAQALAVAKELQLDHAALNVWGGATAIGHPLGATGLRIALTLARQMRDRKQKNGIASACIGGGQGVALLLEDA